jgi:hypothetical protein
VLCQRLDVWWLIPEMVHSLALRACITRNLSVDKPLGDRARIRRGCSDRLARNRKVAARLGLAGFYVIGSSVLSIQTENRIS